MASGQRRPTICHAEASSADLLPRSGPGRYLAMWPVYVISDDPNALMFSIAVDDASHVDLYSQSRSLSNNSFLETKPATQ